MVTRVLDDLSLDGDGHTAYPPGACSPVHFSGCLRCLEAENATLREQLQDADTQIATLKAHAAHLGEELKRARAFEAQAQELGALLAKASVDTQDAERASGQSWVRLVSDELEDLYQRAIFLPQPERTKVIPTWTDEELWAVRKDPPKEFQELAELLSATLTPAKWDGCAHVLIKLEEIAALNYEELPTWSSRPDLAELHRRLEWALATIKAQESSQ